jgi:hypothetical protein
LHLHLQKEFNLLLQYTSLSNIKNIALAIYMRPHSCFGNLVMAQGFELVKVEQVCEKKIKKKNIEKHEKWK